MEYEPGRFGKAARKFGRVAGRLALTTFAMSGASHLAGEFTTNPTVAAVASGVMLALGVSVAVEPAPESRGQDD